MKLPPPLFRARAERLRRLTSRAAFRACLGISAVTCFQLSPSGFAVCRHADTGILKYADVDALVAAVLPGAAPVGAAPTQVTRTLL